MEVVRSKRKTISIEVKPGGRVVVRAPLYTADRQIEAFVADHRDWIDRTVARLQHQKPQPELTAEQLKNLRIAAKSYLPGRIDAFAKQMGLTGGFGRLKPAAIHYTGAKTRWGSCSPKNSISFSVRLLQYPPEAIDYVVVHELAHIKEHNHSPRFWALVERTLPDYRERQKLLKQPPAAPGEPHPLLQTGGAGEGR